MFYAFDNIDVVGKDHDLDALIERTRQHKTDTAIWDGPRLAAVVLVSRHLGKEPVVLVRRDLEMAALILESQWTLAMEGG